MKGSRAIALKRGLIQSRPPSLAFLKRSLVHSLSVAPSSSRSITAPPSGLPGNIRYHSTSQSGPSGQLPILIPEIKDADSYDIVIIGAANAGLALACSLLDKPSIRSGSRILLLEGGSLDGVKAWDGEGDWENRVSSLTAENVAWLDSIGVWQYIKHERSCPVNEMIVWANPNTESTPTIHFPPLAQPMARMTENMNLQQALYKRIKSAGKGVIDIRERGRVSEMREGGDGRWIGLRIGENHWVRGSLVIGADGPNSPVRHYSQIETYGHAYPTHAVVATMHHPPSPIYPNNTAFQRFLPTGPLAFLPLSEEASTMVWSTRPDLAAALKKISPEAMTVMVNAGYSVPESTLEVLNQQILITPPDLFTVDKINSIIQSQPALPNSIDQTLPPSITSISPKSIASFPLRLSHADTYTAHRTVLVGDAAHTIHPLAGQGLNMGLADVRSLANSLEKAKKTGMDLGSDLAIRDYPKERYFENHLMLSATDHLNQIFGSRNGVVNWIRGTGLDVINEVGWVKKVFMAGAGAGVKVTGTGARSAKSRTGTGEAGLGWQGLLANAVEGAGQLRGVVRGVASMAGDMIKSSMRRGPGQGPGDRL